MIRLVVTDLDGTLWGRDMIVPPEHVAAIATLADRGVTVMVATARRPRVVDEGLWSGGLTLPVSSLPVVALDGAVGIDLATGVRFHDASFPRSSAVDALATFRRFGLDPCVYVDDPLVDVVVSEHPSTCAEHRATLDPYARIGPLDDAVEGSTVFNFAILGLPRSQLAPVAEALALRGAEVVVQREDRFGEWGLVVGPPNVTKWNGVAAYCRSNGIDVADVLAVGDGDNDIAMLRHAGVAVGVRGGTLGSLAEADHLIDPPEQDGWSALPDIVSRCS